MSGWSARAMYCDMHTAGKATLPPHKAAGSNPATDQSDLSIPTRFERSIINPSHIQLDASPYYRYVLYEGHAHLYVSSSHAGKTQHSEKAVVDEVECGISFIKSGVCGIMWQ